MTSRTPLPIGRSTATPFAVQPLRERERGENFPVVLAVLPRRYREALHAVYGFARTVDELGDTAIGDRIAQLRALESRLPATWSGEPVADPVLAALQRTVVAHGVDAQPFHDLIEANLQDQAVSRYRSYAQLRDYCRLSADPVGRIVLQVFDASTEENVRLSDSVCTALQLVEHWQDVGEDRRAGRVYLPVEDLERYGVAESDLDLPTATPALASLVRFEIERAAHLLEAGAPLVGELHGWARPCVAGFVAGGRATVAALRRTHGDVLGTEVRPSRPGTATRLVGLLARAALTRGPVAGVREAAR